MGSNLWSCKFLLATKGSNPSSVLLLVPSVRFTLVSFMPAAGWKKMTEEEVRLANAWYTEDGLPPSAIAERLGRDKSVLTRLLVKQVPQKKQGRPPSLSQAQVTYLKRLLDKMVRKADCKYTVTAAMLKKAAKLKVGERVIRDALHQQKVYFRKLREKPVLTPKDVKDRLAFARKYHGKTPGWWNKHLHAIIDGKSFKVYLNADGRKKAAQHATYGAYRAPGQGLAQGYVKPKKTLLTNPGARNELILAAVGNGKMMMWHKCARWNGAAAKAMYTGPLAKALKKAYPTKSKFIVLEDNDPSGFKSSKGVAGKIAAKIHAFEIPRRSPDLNVQDYAIWKEINRRMRLQEQKWPRGKREARGQYLTRLRRTALRLPKAFITKSIGDMHRRCKRLLAAKGGFIEEGGQ